MGSQVREQPAGAGSRGAGEELQGRLPPHCRPGQGSPIETHTLVTHTPTAILFFNLFFVYSLSRRLQPASRSILLISVPTGTRAKVAASEDWTSGASGPGTREEGSWAGCPSLCSPTQDAAAETRHQPVALTARWILSFLLQGPGSGRQGAKVGQRECRRQCGAQGRGGCRRRWEQASHPDTTQPAGI